MHSKIIFLAQALPQGRVFGLDMQTLISIGIQLLNGIILALALSFILYKPVKEFLQKRSDGIHNKINHADETMAKANELIAEYDKKMEDINKERLEILEVARLKADEERKITLEEAKIQADELKQRSLDSISEDKKRLQDDARLHIIELASLMAEKYIIGEIDTETQNKIFEESLSEMEDSQWQN